MKIEIDKSTISIEGYVVPVNNVSYFISKQKDSITYYLDNITKLTGIINETTVNGVQMTPDNIDELLSPLFFLDDNADLEAEIKRIEAKLNIIVDTDDPNGVIDKWDEIVKFLEGIDEDESLLTILLDQKQKLRSEGSELFGFSVSNFVNLVKAGYNVLIADSNLLATDKTNLSNTFTEYSAKANVLISSISDAISTGKTSDAQFNKLKTAAQDYSSAILTYRTVEEQVRQNLVKTRINEIEIGGVNLLRNSHKLKVGYSEKSGIVSSVESDGSLKIEVSATGSFLNSFLINPALNDSSLQEGDEITISYWMKSANATKPFRFYLKGGMGYYDMLGSIVADYTQISITVTYKKAGNISIHIYPTQIGTYYLKYLQVEKGNKASDWSPAPEDIQAQIQALSDRISKFE